MTRTGKIARLPLHIRNQLNQRLEDGEVSDAILRWLNEHSTVQETTKRLFNSQPVSKQNLSAWRRGGFKEWQRLQESHAFLHRLVERSDDLTEKGGEIELTDRLAQLAAGELARVFERLLEQTDDPQERFKLVQALIRELVPLRAGSQRAAQLQLNREQSEIAGDRYWEARQESDRQKLRKKVTAPLWASLQMGNLAALFGGGEHGRQAAAIILETNYDLELGTLNRAPRSNPVKPSPTQSK